MEDSPLDLLLTSGVGPYLAALWGALWGSFANVVIERLPRGESVMRPASHCLSCGAPIRFYDNVPLLSFLLLRGRCRACGVRFSPRYFLVEALGVVLGLLCFHLTVTQGEGSPAMRLASFLVAHLFTMGLIAVVFIDLSTMIIPDALTLPMLLVFGSASVALGRVTWQEAALGAAAGFVPLWLLREAWLRFRGVEGLGLGDAKLLGAVGAVLGWKALPAVVLLGSVQGLLVAVPFRLLGRSLVATQAYQGTAVRPACPEEAPDSPDTGGAAGPEHGDEASAHEEPPANGEPPPGQASGSEGSPTSGDADRASQGTAAPSDVPEDGLVQVDEVPAGAVPFGPFLALAAIEALLWGPSLSEWMAGALDALIGAG